MFTFKLKNTVDINCSVCSPIGEDVKKQQSLLYYHCCRDSKFNS